MAFEVTFSANPRMLVVNAHSVGDSRESQRAFQEVQGHAEYYQGVPILIDASKLESSSVEPQERVFTALFATAFPCSLLAFLGTPREFHAAATEVAQFSATRGATVAAFTDRKEALAWMTEQSAALDADPVVHDASTGSTRRRVPNGVVIPYTLREKIETTHVEVDGRACSLRLDSAAGRPAADPDIAEVTVSTSVAGFAQRATADVRVSRLDDEDYVLGALVDAMKAALASAGSPAIA
jgi:hypothetical protein